MNGEDISETWTRRPDKFDFEIEDVLNAQGFDGLPRVVSSTEFNDAVKAANGGNGFIAQRAYSAPSSDILEAYQQELYNGKWYVDCSVRGAAYGQGMYATGDFTGKITEDMQNASKFYADLGKRDGHIASKVETFTLERNAKVVDYVKLRDDFTQYGMRIQSENAEIRRVATKEASKALADSLLEKAGYADNENARRFLYGNLSIEKVPWDEMGKRYSALAEKANDVMQLQQEFYRQQSSFTDSYVAGRMKSEIKDIGSFAAASGYDAISVTDHGIYNTTEVVILNRTKCIIWGGKET